MSLRLGNSIGPSVLTYADFLKEKSRFPDIEMLDFVRQKKEELKQKWLLMSRRGSPNTVGSSDFSVGQKVCHDFSHR